jgi:hypothetical protein
VALEVVHQRLHRRGHRRTDVPWRQPGVPVQDGRDLFLQIEAQLVLPPPRRQVHGDANLQQPLPGRLEGGRLAGRHLAHALQRPRVARAEPGQGRPPPRAKVAQPAGTVFQVWLEQEDRVTEARVAGPLLGAQPGDQAVGGGPGHPRAVQGQEAIPQRPIAGQEARVQQRRRRGQVGRRQLQRLGHRAHGVAGVDLGVPEGMQDGPRQLLDLAVGRLRTQEDQVQVRVRGELAPPEAASGQHREAGRRVELCAREVVVHQVDHHRLHLGGQLLGQLETVLAGAQARGGVRPRRRHPGDQGRLRPRFEVAVFGRGHRRGARILNAAASPCRQ